MRLFKNFPILVSHGTFFCRKSLLFIGFCGLIFTSNLCIALNLPGTLHLLGLEKILNTAPSLILIFLSSLSLLALCGFFISLRHPFDLSFLGIFTLFSLFLAVRSFSSRKMADISFCQQKISFLGHILSKQTCLFMLLAFLAVLFLIAFLPFAFSETPLGKTAYALPCLVLFGVIMAGASYHFRQAELPHFITSKTGLIASFAGKNGGLRFLYPNPSAKISQWQEAPGANLETDHAGKRTALLLRREFPGIIGETAGFFLIQLSSD